MSYRRIHVRVPLEAKALVSSEQTSVIKARAIDISHGGVAVTDMPAAALPEADYHIEVTIQDGRKINLTTRLVRQTDKLAAFQAFHINQRSWKIIRELVFNYQETDDYIRQMEEYRLLDNYLVDDSGNEIDISFDVDPDKP
ncbi:PilZ domain-containing protein [bacterium]|nr:PilZ domain-containing protein [bacterium]